MSDSDSSVLRSAWIDPAVLAVLQIIGDGVVERALAQMSGSLLSPVAFSFGWVAYSFNSLVLAFGDNKLMPEPDFSCIVINARDGYSRNNASWLLGRVVRDFEYWKPKAVEEMIRNLLEEATESDFHKAEKHAHEHAAQTGEAYKPPPVQRRQRAGLCISIFQNSTSLPAGVPTRDLLFYSSFLVALAQLGIAVIPWVLYDDWAIFMITGVGILLSFSYGAFPQWRAEKWEARRQAKTVLLTTGNGSQHVIVIVGDANALDLTDLATGKGCGSRITQVLAAVFAVLWLALLITVIGMQKDPWFLLAVGGLGMADNVVVAGVPRRPGAMGLHLEFVECIGHVKVMKALMAAEEKYPGVGACLVPTFFPGDLRPDEQQFWSDKLARRTGKGAVANQASLQRTPSNNSKNGPTVDTLTVPSFFR